MQRHFHDELRLLKQKLLKMGFLVEETIAKAIKGLLERDPKLAQEVFEDEKKVNQYEIDIDSDGHSLLALGQPMAVDLRLITMILKINTDLERMGDHAVNIAERTLLLVKELPIKIDLHLPEMARSTQEMLREALDAFVNSDVNKSRTVLERDDVVDQFNDNLYRDIVNLIEKDSSWTKAGFSLAMVGHNLERIADLASNIAEDVIYLKQGKEVRHHSAASD